MWPNCLIVSCNPFGFYSESQRVDNHLIHPTGLPTLLRTTTCVWYVQNNFVRYIVSLHWQCAKFWNIIACTYFFRILYPFTNIRGFIPHYHATGRTTGVVSYPDFVLPHSGWNDAKQDKLNTCNGNHYSFVTNCGVDLAATLLPVFQNEIVSAGYWHHFGS